MASVIKPKRSETPSSVPTSGNLAVGEIAVNTADGKIYIKDSGNAIVELGGGGAGGASVSVSTTPPGSPSSGDLWWNSESGELFVWYNDGTSSQWVGTAVGAQGATGATGATGDSSYVYIAYASDASGTGFTTTFNSSLDYIAIKTTTSPIGSPSSGDFTGLWKKYKGEYIYIAYASDASGTGFTTTFNASLDYIAVKVSQTPLTPVVGDFSGLWKNYKGATGAAGDDAYVYIAYASDASGTGFTTTFNASLDYIAVKNSTTPLTPVSGDFTGLWKNYKGATGSTGPTGPFGPKALTIYNPLNNENVTLFYTASALTISSAIAVVAGTTPSVTYSVSSGSNRSSATETHISAQTVTSTTTGTAPTIADSTIAANTWVWLTTSATSGTITSFSISLSFS